MGFGKDGKGAIIRENASQAIGALAAGGVIKIDTDLALEEDFRVLKQEIICQVHGLTAGQGKGMILGLADNELTTTEIGECIGVNGPNDRNDRLKVEQAERMVRLIGAIHSDELTNGTKVQFVDEGRIIKIKPRWTFSNVEGWTFFIYNRDGAEITTGATCRINVTNYGVWVT